MPPIDRTKYDNLVRIHEELGDMADINHPLISLAAHAARVARDNERPTVRVTNRAQDDRYPSCPDDCRMKGYWGATGILAPGHMLVMGDGSMRLAHDPDYTPTQQDYIERRKRRG